MSDDVLLPDWARRLPLMAAECCRVWPVFAAVPLRRCGYCGQVPVVTGEWEPCRNCDGRKCMACVFREVHDRCEDSCPFCCEAP